MMCPGGTSLTDLVATARRRSREMQAESQRLIGRSRELIEQSWRQADLEILAAEFELRLAAARAESLRMSHLN